MNISMNSMIDNGGKTGLTCLFFVLSCWCYGHETSIDHDHLRVGHHISSATIIPGRSHIEVESWNHIPGGEQEFSNLTQGSSAYDISYKNVLAEHGLNLEINTVLVKKIINSTRQHSNGIKLIFSDNPPAIGQLDKLSFELKVHYDQMALPSKAKVLMSYNLGSKQAEVEKVLLNDTAYLNFTLFGRSHDDQQLESILATKIVALPMKADNQDWFTLELNMANFHYYWQQNWQERPVKRKDVKQEKILGLLITAESQNAKTLQYYLTSELLAGFEEHFIEIPINIRTSAQLYFNE